MDLNPLAEFRKMELERHPDFFKLIHDEELQRRFVYEAAQDPWRTKCHLLASFDAAVKDRNITIGDRTYTVSEAVPLPSVVKESENFVLQVQTEGGGLLYAKADISHHFILHTNRERPADGRISRVHGSRGIREGMMERYQEELGLPHAHSTRIGFQENQWIVSEPVPGPRVCDASVLPLVRANVESYCRQLGQNMAFVYVMGIDDVHYENGHFDGKLLTLRDLEFAFSDAKYGRYPIAKESVDEDARSFLFLAETHPEESLIADPKVRRTLFRERVSQSLEFFLWPVMDYEPEKVRELVERGFNEFWDLPRDKRQELFDDLFDELGPFGRRHLYLENFHSIARLDTALSNALDDDRCHALLSHDYSPVFPRIWDGVTQRGIHEAKKYLSDTT